ncbi:hypothetical protein [Dictyobacter aurantiacus]|nr:hypothetical protein [Dictyobacter aurantiacus]
MQTFKRWLNRLFSWWPWRSTATVNRVQASDSRAWSAVPEAAWYTSINGAEAVNSQSNNTTIAIEHDLNAPSIEHPMAADAGIPSPDESNFFGQPSILSAQQSVVASEQPAQDSTDAENHLLFLRYLIQHGILNEGFKEGQVPKQYRNK